jgi:hypothetical protein
MSGQQLRRLPDAAAAASVAGRRTQQRLTQADKHTHNEAMRMRALCEASIRICFSMTDALSGCGRARVHT